jgi:phosphoserine phosphatase RsbU/P
MGILTLIVVALWVTRILLITPRISFLFPWLGFSFGLLNFLLLFPAIYYSWKLVKYARSRTLWKISRRLMLANVFIGAIPILFVIVIFYTSSLLFYYQLSYYLISNQIGIRKTQIHAFNLSLSHSLQQIMTRSSSLTPDALNKALNADAQYLLAAFPSASIRLTFRDPNHQERIIAYDVPSPSPLKRRVAPDWLGNDFSGLIVEDDQEESDKSKLYIRSYITSEFQFDVPFSLEVSVPCDAYFLGRLQAALGQDMLLAKHAEHSGWTWMFPNTDIPPENILVKSTFGLQEKDAPASPMWPLDLYPILWSSGKEISSAKTDVLMVEVSFSKLINNLFYSKMEISRVGAQIYLVLKMAVILFLVVEIVSIFIGIGLTKSITNAVYNLDRGTEFVKRGDFSQRIIVKSNDQLGALAESFNQMTEYVQQLVKERVQKERMERELEIAKEVQERLFPSQAPRIGRLDIAGICLPARTVSGDYYDFLLLGRQELGLALGDICGKGISAALLMATLQATLRSNVMNLWSRDRRNGGKKIVAEVVERLNSQIFNYTAANKFASFFYALYNDAQQTLTYCNAGHNPPLYFSGDEVKRLNTGGTVVGIFADSKYDQETIQLSSGDLLVAYTDGIVESINEHGEEFGENRLIQAIQESRNLSATRIKDLVVEKVLAWTFAEERGDDMTLIVARIDKPS